MELNTIVSEVGTLVDIRDVSVNKELSRDERIAEFVQQIKNPYHFKCGRFTVQASFSAEGATLEYGITTLLELRGFFCATKGVFFYAGLQSD